MEVIIDFLLQVLLVTLLVGAHSREPVVEDHFTNGVCYLPVYREVVLGDILIMPLAIDRNNIFRPLAILKNKVNSLYSNFQHVTNDSQIIKTLKNTIINFQFEYEKLTENLQEYVWLILLQHRQKWAAVIGTSVASRFISDIVTRYQFHCFHSKSEKLQEISLGEKEHLICTEESWMPLSKT